METCIALLAVVLGLPGILAASLALAFVFIIWLPRTAKADEKTPAPAPVTVENVKGLSRDEINQKLTKLKETPAPVNLKSGAKCYASAGPPSRAEYVCPKCGEKTLYTNQMAQVVAWTVPDARRKNDELQKAAGASVTLDESQFCRKCSPEVKDPKLVLQIVYADGKPQTVVGVSPDDLTLLTELFSGKLVHDGGMSGEKPLKNYSKRLQELLGIEMK